jgi:hypothetical protein
VEINTVKSQVFGDVVNKGSTGFCFRASRNDPFPKRNVAAGGDVPNSIDGVNVCDK